VRNAIYIATLCALFFASGCGRGGGKITVGNPETDTFKDGQYYQSLMGMNVARQYGDFLERCTPTDRVKYINKSVEESQPTHIYPLKAAYERFANDTNAEVAAAAKEALTKVPTPEEFERLRKEEIEAQKK
jgi:hypothetical protein